MKFHFEKLIIWLKNGKIRTLDFEPNKVNIVTGESNTGKTAILDIIDYCFFASRHKISHSIINENASWYGIKILINGKSYVLARKSPVGNNTSEEYYLSSIGEFSDTLPIANISGAAAKTAIEAEFGIDSDTKFAYGGNQIRANSKISLRYFLVFNTISQDIITHSEEYFDKQKENRYREALPRSFDLALGIDTVENLLKKERKDEINHEIKKYSRKEKQLSESKRLFSSEKSDIVKTAREYSLISDEADIDVAIEELKGIVENINNIEIPLKTKAIRDIDFEIYETIKKVKNLKRFQNELNRYKKNLMEVDDSLKPIEYVKEHLNEILQTSIFEKLINDLEENYRQIKQSISGNLPVETNVNEQIKKLQHHLTELTNVKKSHPDEVKKFESSNAKFLFLGEVKAKLQIYSGNDQNDLDSEKVSSLRRELETIKVDSIEEKRGLFQESLDEIIQEYIDLTKSALDNYSNYRAHFNYTEKKLQLRKPKETLIENVGSSSNHMFMHLFLFLGLHQVIANHGVNFVAPFLIIDQFSRPYWGDVKTRKSDIDNSDISKVDNALLLLNSFIEHFVKNNKDFQIIVFEHIKKEMWDNYDYIHLVEDFSDGNALIPLKYLEL